MSIPQILVVEDKAIIAKDIQKTLIDAGYLVPTAVGSGEQAIQKAEELQPDLILMDIRLKGEMDGITAASHIHERFEIPVIFLTAHADDETLARAIATNPFGYIVKPFDERELHIAIQVALHKVEIEKKLKTQERWLAATLESIGDAVLSATPQGEIVSLNRAAQTLTGWTVEEAQQKDVTEIVNLVEEVTKSPLPNPLRQALHTGSATTLGDSPLLLTRTGSKIPVNNLATPIRDEHNNIIGAVLVLRDMQKMRQLEEQLRQSQKLEAVGQLAAGMAHNFNNLLTIISLNVGITRQMLPEEHIGKKKLHIVEETTKRAADLVQHLLAFARRQIRHSELIQINKWLQNLYPHLRQLLPAQITLALQLKADLDDIQMDANQLKQVIINLVMNARDVLGDTGGHITMRTSTLLLENPLTTLPSGVPSGHYICLEIEDDGPGMTHEVLTRIFEPFFTTKDIGQGTGLGLSTCLGIVEQNYGRITVTSQPNQGARFSLYLPLYKPAPPSTEPAQEGPHLSKSEAIMVVEDDDQIREAIVLSLREQGFYVLEANNGAHALRYLQANPDQPIHLLVTDVLMPEMGGNSLYEILNATHDSLKVLFISGYPDTESVPTNIAFLSKPFDADTLLQKIREILATNLN